MRTSSSSNHFRLGTAAAVLAIAALLAFTTKLSWGLAFDTFNGPIALVYLALAFAHILAVPKRELSLPFLLANAALVAGTGMVYLASGLPVLLAGLLLSALPMMLFPGPDGRRAGLPAAALTLSTLALAAAAYLIEIPHQSRAAFVAFTLAVALRKGIFPAHSWVAVAFERRPLWLAGLTSNGHLGVVLMVRFAIPLLAGEAKAFTSVVADMALITAIGSAVIALVEQSPRRLLSWLYLSQASLILAGLESANTEGITGALLQMMVVTVSTTMLAIVLACVESRYGHGLRLDEYHGLAGRIPRLAAFFLVAGLALVGLPGTLGFCAEDLLLHGMLQSHPALGMILPVTTALNAWNLLRGYSRLFLGKAGKLVPAVADALPREAIFLALFCLALVVTGLLPQLAVQTREPAGARLAGYLSGEPVHTRRLP